MAIKIRTKRLATSATNPRRVVRKPRPAKKKRTRKMSPKQIRHFGTKRQRAALKAKRDGFADDGKDVDPAAHEGVPAPLPPTIPDNDTLRGMDHADVVALAEAHGHPNTSDEGRISLESYLMAKRDGAQQ